MNKILNILFQTTLEEDAAKQEEFCDVERKHYLDSILENLTPQVVKSLLRQYFNMQYRPIHAIQRVLVLQMPFFSSGCSVTRSCRRRIIPNEGSKGALVNEFVLL